MTMTTYGASEEVKITDLETQVLNEIEESGAAKTTSNADGTVKAKHVLNSKGQLLISLSKAKGKEVKGELGFGLVDLKKIPWGFENNFGWRNQQKSVHYDWEKVNGQWKQYLHITFTCPAGQEECVFKIPTVTKFISMKL